MSDDTAIDPATAALLEAAEGDLMETLSKFQSTDEFCAAYGPISPAIRALVDAAFAAKQASGESRTPLADCIALGLVATIAEGLSQRVLLGG